MLSIALLVTHLLLSLIPTIAGRDLPTDLTGFPPCAQKCISDNHGDCALLDMPCMCNNQVPDIFSCMQGSCNAEDQATALSFAQELCAQANATSTAKITGTSRTGATTLSTVIQTDTNSPDTVSSPSSSAPSQSGLSTAATAGIGVGAALGVVAVAAGGFFFWRRQKQSGISTDTSVPAVQQMEQDYTMYSAYERKGMMHHEVDGVQWTELEAKEVTRYIH